MKVIEGYRIDREGLGGILDDVILTLDFEG